jgi:NAD(P)-dependent dehydrogenase (short-subunit alcohol dehydrogenase family)
MQLLRLLNDSARGPALTYDSEGGEMKGLDGKVAIVTGGATTFGEAVVQAFAASGTLVSVGDIDGEGERVAGEIGDRAWYCRMDLGVDADVERIVAETSARFGGIDFLVNMAASYVDEGIETTRDDWLHALNVNVVGGARMVQAVRPHMKRRGGGAIVNFGSVGGKTARAGRWVYPASKAAVIHLTRCQAVDLAPDNVRVNSVSPAWTWSRPLRQAANENRELAREFAAELHILRRFAEPAEVADAVLFLCSEHASFISGCDLACDGGNSALGPEGLRSPIAELRQRSG